MTATVLGCSGSYPGPGQACSGFLVRTDTTTVWLDAGPGTLANLQRHIDLLEVDAIVLSHEHPDHCADLAGYYVACKYYRQRGHVAVYAPAGLQESVYYSGAPLAWHEVAGGDEVDVGGLHLTFSRTDHPPETLAVRVDGDGRSLAYSADTGPRWSLEQLGPGIDLAICEATFLRSHEGSVQHLSARQAGESARAAGVRRLVLSHLQPGLNPDASRDEGSAAFGALVEMAAEHQIYEV
ncbi:MAG TPA: MBL fold metallo-hydrolase [Acidimicrobiales bacterium]|nr:MBL fold metallo-hydrolase [Acidimicrobiales bacterium]